MISTNSFTSTNPHIAALEPAFAKSARPIEWLVIAHSDPRLIKSLSSALAGHSAAVLELPQKQWDFDGDDFSETVEWAMRKGDIQIMVLVGSSQSGSATRGVSLRATRSKGQVEDGYAALLERVQRHLARVSDVQHEFAGHVQQLSRLPVVHSRWASQQLEVCGLFYRAEAGLFLYYDPQADKFAPLSS